MDDEIQIITPPTADQTEVLDFSLVALTEAISKLSEAAISHGVLGGEFGYGARWENDTFMMHPFCWCEKPECLWCTIWLSNEVDCTETEAEAHRAKQEQEILNKYGQWCANFPQAPHFWHKASGLQVRWYKWIGRDMEVHNPNNADVATVFRECMASLK